MVGNGGILSLGSGWPKLQICKLVYTKYLLTLGPRPPLLEKNFISKKFLLFNIYPVDIIYICNVAWGKWCKFCKPCSTNGYWRQQKLLDEKATWLNFSIYFYIIFLLCPSPQVKVHFRDRCSVNIFCGSYNLLEKMQAEYQNNPFFLPCILDDFLPRFCLLFV